MKKVLITGASGFLGAYTVREFLKYKDDYDILATGRNTAKLKELGVRFLKADLTCASDCDCLFNGENIDTVVHIAALSTVWGTWEDFENANVKGTANLIGSAIKNNVKRFVFVSSPSIYSCAESRYNISEYGFDDKNDLNYYIKSKIKAEQVVRSRDSLIETVIIRPRGLIGIGDTSIIPRLLNLKKIPLINNGKNLVDVTCVENVAYALRLCVDKSDIGGLTFNITNGEPHHFKDILEEFFKNIGRKPVYKKFSFRTLWVVASILEFFYKTFRIKGEPMLTKYTVCTLGFSQTLDITLAKRFLGYKPIKTLEQCIQEYGEWYREENKKH